MDFLVVALNAALTALNVALYANSGNPVSLFAAVFCGCLFLFSVAIVVRGM